jgi:hypothetical protein
MDKKKLHHFWRRFRLLKPWYFFVVTGVFVTICVFSLRNNYQQMVVLRNDVYQADKNNGNVSQALNDLRSYVYAHMNTNLSTGADTVYPPIQLKYTYDRLVAAEAARVSAANSQIYTDAQHYCEQLYPNSFSGGPRVPCITSYVSGHGIKAQTIPDGLYKFSFISPTWSPDLAGWSMVIAALSGFLTVLLLLVRRWFKVSVK